MKHTVSQWTTVAILDDEEPYKMVLGQVEDAWYRDCKERGFKVIGKPVVTSKRVVSSHPMLPGEALQIDVTGEVASVEHLVSLVKFSLRRKQARCKCGWSSHSLDDSEELSGEISKHLSETSGGDDDAQEGTEAEQVHQG